MTTLKDCMTAIESAAKRMDAMADRIQARGDALNKKDGLVARVPIEAGGPLKGHMKREDS